MFDFIADAFQGFHHEVETVWNPDGIFAGYNLYSDREPLFRGERGTYDRVTYKVYANGYRVEESREHAPADHEMRNDHGLYQSYEWCTYIRHSQAEEARKEELRSQDRDRLTLIANQLITEGKAGVVATVENTFDNGYTSVWHYKVSSTGQCSVQKPWGNQARAFFDSVEDMVADFERYLGYGFQAV